MEKLCRACMLESINMKNIFSNSLTPLKNLSEIVMACASVQIYNNDDLPKQICSDCIEQLNIAYRFKQKCEKSDDALKRLIKLKQEEANIETIKYCDAEVLNDINKSEIKIENTVNTHENVTFKSSLKKKYTCKICNRKFIQFDIYNNHIRTHDVSEDRKPCITKHLATNALRRRFLVHSKSNFQHEYKCTDCPKVFRSLAGLNYHKNTHTGVRNFHCDQCNKRFIAYANLAAHKLRHNRVYRFLCSECGRKFLTKGELSRHFSRHTDEKQFKCDKCDRRFASKEGLRHHDLRHKGEKPFLCYVCSKKFTTNANLRAHMHSHTGAKPHVCEICQNGFISTSDLRTHMRIHSGERPYRCAECDRGFARSGSLKVHMRTHSGDRPYQCRLCPVRFKHSKSLSRHMKKHTEPQCAERVKIETC